MGVYMADDQVLKLDKEIQALKQNNKKIIELEKRRNEAIKNSLIEYFFRYGLDAVLLEKVRQNSMGLNSNEIAKIEGYIETIRPRAKKAKKSSDSQSV